MIYAFLAMQAIAIFVGIRRIIININRLITEKNEENKPSIRYCNECYPDIGCPIYDYLPCPGVFPLTEEDLDDLAKLDLRCGRLSPLYWKHAEIPSRPVGVEIKERTIQDE
jgi:hypothetical protein